MFTYLVNRNNITKQVILDIIIEISILDIPAVILAGFLIINKLS